MKTLDHSKLLRVHFSFVSLALSMRGSVANVQSSIVSKPLKGHPLTHPERLATIYLWADYFCTHGTDDLLKKEFRACDVRVGIKLKGKTMPVVTEGNAVSVLNLSSFSLAPLPAASTENLRSALTAFLKDDTARCLILSTSGLAYLLVKPSREGRSFIYVDAGCSIFGSVDPTPGTISRQLSALHREWQEGRTRLDARVCRVKGPVERTNTPPPSESEEKVVPSRDPSPPAEPVQPIKPATPEAPGPVSMEIEEEGTVGQDISQADQEVTAEKDEPEAPVPAPAEEEDGTAHSTPVREEEPAPDLPTEPEPVEVKKETPVKRKRTSSRKRSKATESSKRRKKDNTELDEFVAWCAEDGEDSTKKKKRRKK